MIDNKGLACLREDGLIAPQLLIVIECILFILSLGLSTDILASHVLDDAAHVVVFAACHPTTSSHNDLVSTPAKVLFVMDKEIFTALHPHVNLVSPAVGRSAHLQVIKG